MTDDRSSNDGGSRNPDSGTETRSTVLVETGSAPAPAVPAAVIGFERKAGTITSSVLTILAYTLNWWSHSHGQGEYVPDWAIGLMWAPWGVNLVNWAKDRLGPKAKS